MNNDDTLYTYKSVLISQILICLFEHVFIWFEQLKKSSKMSHFSIWFYWYGVRCSDTCQNDLTSSLVQHYMYISQQDFNNININGQND